MSLSSHFFLFPNSLLVPKCTKHCVFTCKCNLCAFASHFFYSLIRNLFQTAKNIVFSQVNAACVSRPIFFYSLIHNLFQHAQNMSLSSNFFLFPNSQLIPKCTKHCVFTGKCKPLCFPSHFFLFPISQLIPNCKKHCVFTGKCCMCLSSPFFPIP